LAFKALNLTRTKTYESNLDPEKGTENATKFVLGALDTRLMTALADKSFEVVNTADGDQVNKSNQLTIAYNMVRFGLKGWTNYADEDGNPLEFKSGTANIGGKTYPCVQDDLLARLPLELVMELAGEVQSVNRVDEDEAKK
jgi:hypothetical protein